MYLLHAIPHPSRQQEHNSEHTDTLFSLSLHILGKANNKNIIPYMLGIFF